MNHSRLPAEESCWGKLLGKTAGENCWGRERRSRHTDAMSSPDRFDGTPDHLRELADQIADGLLARTLPKPRWTHEAHLLACVSLIRRHGPARALDLLRAGIPPYNEATGVQNTPTAGYHDTITVYFVWAIDRLLAAGLGTADVLHAPQVERTAMFAWWDRDTLMSPAARAGWVPPNRADAPDAPRPAPTDPALHPTVHVTTSCRFS